MSVVIILLIASLLVAGGFLAAFLWAVRNGQYDDLETPAARILFDDADAIIDKKSTSFPKE
jgi:cbb3-type cytochrome oxidase maturation protein